MMELVTYQCLGNPHSFTRCQEGAEGTSCNTVSRIDTASNMAMLITDRRLKSLRWREGSV